MEIKKNMGRIVDGFFSSPDLRAEDDDGARAWGKQ
jgi:hypothetical protein